MAMEKLNVDELLRYGFSGALFLLSPLVSFKEAACMIKKLPSNIFGASAVLGIALVIGSIIYSVHRAVLYQVLYKLGCIVVYGKNKADTLKLDSDRWERYKNPYSSQIYFREWASQIHFLYCSLWAIVFSQIVGMSNNWTHTDLYWAVWLTAVALGIAAVVHHYRYLSYEHKLFGGETI